MRAHWRHLANMIELVVPWAYPNPQPKWQIYQFSRFCTAHSRKSLYCTMRTPFPKNYPHLINDSLGQSKPSTQMSSPLVQPFLHRWPQSFPILHSGPLLPPQDCPFPCGIWTPSNTWFRGPVWVLNPNGIWIGSAVLRGSLVWHIDRRRYLVGNNRPHLRT